MVKLKYHSLTKKLHEIDFEDVWKIFQWKERLYVECPLSNTLNSFSNVEFYNASNGLASSIFNNVFKANTSLYVGTLKGIYTYNNFQYTSNDTTHIKQIKVDQTEKLWMLSENNFTNVSQQYTKVNNNFLGSLVAGLR